MNRGYVIHIVRALVFIMIQVLIFKRITFSFGDFGFLHLFLYPLAIALLPIKTPRPVTLLFGFCVGIIVDMFYDSPGVHASACVFIAYLRSYILSMVEPHEGYATDTRPTASTMGLGWFFTYISIFFGLFLFIYFSVEAFSFVFIFEIILNSIFSLIASLAIILLYTFIFNPKN